MARPLTQSFEHPHMISSFQLAYIFTLTPNIFHLIKILIPCINNTIKLIITETHMILNTTSLLPMFWLNKKKQITATPIIVKDIGSKIDFLFSRFLFTTYQ